MHCPRGMMEFGGAWIDPRKVSVISEIETLKTKREQHGSIHEELLGYRLWVVVDGHRLDVTAQSGHFYTLEELRKKLAGWIDSYELFLENERLERRHR